jgi:bleomycin hydrolase
MPLPVTRCCSRASRSSTRAPRKWRVKNSWGDQKADKGFWPMNDSWSDEHAREIAARRDQLPPELLVASAAEPIVLPAWDPTGLLAR